MRTCTAAQTTKIRLRFGMGMGIDRLLIAITGLGIRDTVLFPLVK